MQNNADIFGAALASYYHDNKNSELLLHSEDKQTYSIPVGVFFRAADSLELDGLALKLCKGTVLDVGAGAGEHSLFLQQRGLCVTALDILPMACTIMEARGVKNVMHKNILDESTLPGFDTWLVLGRSIGAVGNLDGFRQFLQKAKKSLRPDGVIIANSQNIPDKNSWSVRKLVFEFEGNKGELTPWMDIGEILLTQEASKMGFIADIVHRDEQGNYLTLLRLS